jgi:hypothetical protein
MHVFDSRFQALDTLASLGLRWETMLSSYDAACQYVLAEVSMLGMHDKIQAMKNKIKETMP